MIRSTRSSRTPGTSGPGMNLRRLGLAVACLLAVVNTAPAVAQDKVLTGAEAREVARQKGWVIRRDFQGRTFELQKLVNGLPVYYITDNLNSADTISTDECWPGYPAALDLSGAGVKLGIWDAGGVRTSHQEFGGRAVQRDSASYTHYHSTHVAGTMIAQGVQQAAHGMSFEGLLDCYDWNSDTTEMQAAAAAGLRVSNHSYGTIRGWIFADYGWGPYWFWWGDFRVDLYEDYLFGFYDDDARQWDQIAYQNPYYLFVKSAGNDRNEGPSPGTEHYFPNWNTGYFEPSTLTRSLDGNNGYDSIAHNGVSKNGLTVGAVQDIPGGWTAPGSVTMSSFSCWGPADDGRIKPDISANGIQLYSTFDTNDTAYESLSGTSMSSPSVSGSLGILIQQWRRTHSGAPDMRAATLKSLVLHTASEAGDAPGPDYRFGWGLMNTLKAALTIERDVQVPDTISENVLANGGSFTQLVQVGPGDDRLRATICWTDPPGTVPAPSLDPADKTLVNDLDLRIEALATGTVYYPWVLDKDFPSQAAFQGDNSVDNVEQVVVDSPAEGDYVIRVTHKGTLSGGQPFSLIVTRECTANASCDDANVCTTDTCQSGFCRQVAVPDGSPCADEVMCNGVEQCQSGTCTVGTYPCPAGQFCDEGDQSYTCDTQSWFMKNLEDGLGGFTIDNTFGDGNGLWHLTEGCDAFSTMLYYGLDDECNYDAGRTEGVVVSPPIDLACAEPPTVLRFNYMLETENHPSYDYAVVEISTDGFQTSTPLASNDPDDAVGLLEESSERGWQQSPAIDLTSVLGKIVRIRFRFRTGDAGINGYRGFYLDNIALSGSLIGPPAAPVNPTPASGAAGVPSDVVLRWESDDGGCPATYDVYLGTNNPPGAVVCSDLDVTSCGVSVAGQQTYYWRVVASNNSGTVYGPVWSFNATECDVDADCDDGIDCTSNACVAGICIAAAHDELCADDGEFCNGPEICDAELGCISGGSPCPSGAICDEDLDNCGPCGSHDQCDDGVFCNGAEECISGFCMAASNPCGAGEVCDEAAQACVSVDQQTIHIQDFEDGLGGYVINNGIGDANGLWHWSTACRASGSDASLYYGIDAECNYDAGRTEGVVTSPPIDVRCAVAPVELTFNYYLETEDSPPYDVASVEVSSNGFATYRKVGGNDTGLLLDPSGSWRSTDPIDVSSLAGDVMQVRFRFRTRDSGLNDYSGFYVDDVNVSAAVYSAPPEPAAPSPGDQSTMQSINPELSWYGTGGGCATTYDVYLGATNPPTARVCNDVSEPHCTAGPLQINKTYYWRVVASRATGTTVGPVWSFTTLDCLTDNDCDDGIPCTGDVCGDHGCEFIPDNQACPEDGVYCNGLEWCDAQIGCYHTGDPCGDFLVCDESAGMCKSDCNANDVSDEVDIAAGTSKDCNDNVQPDECEQLSLYDFDGNGQVDSADCAGLVECFAGMNAPPAPADGQCAAMCLDVFDADGDGDIDLADFADFQQAFGR